MGIRIPSFLKHVRRSQESGDALWAVTGLLLEPTWGLSVGGGPSRTHPALYNLNIAWEPNVDVLGDAYRLPFPASSIPAIHCEAVLEHLEFPEVAVKEMFRVLRPGGEVFAATPFIQAFHAFPSHFQNFTLEGHRRLFSRSGFVIVASGVCVGPVAALAELACVTAREMLPTRMISRLGETFLRLVFLPLKSLDGLALRSAHAHVAASSTFVRARKPLHDGGGASEPGGIA